MKIVVEINDEDLNKGIRQQLDAAVAAATDKLIAERIDDVLNRKFERLDMQHLIPALNARTDTLIKNLMGGTQYEIERRLKAQIAEVITEVVKANLRKGI